GFTSVVEPEDLRGRGCLLAASRRAGLGGGPLRRAARQDHAPGDERDEESTGRINLPEPGQPRSHGRSPFLVLPSVARSSVYRHGRLYWFGDRDAVEPGHIFPDHLRPRLGRQGTQVARYHLP